MTIFWKKDKIISAAVKVVDFENKDNFFLVFGKRHSSCHFLIQQGVFKDKFEALNIQKFQTIDGFYTENWYFLDRAEAWRVVLHNGQLKRLDEDGEIINYDGVDECDSLFLW